MFVLLPMRDMSRRYSNKISCAANQSNDPDPADLEAKKMEEAGSPTLINHEETQESLDTISANPGVTTSGNSLVFNTKYEDPATNVIANVTSVGDLREKVTLSWKNINVFVPQPRASICRRLCFGEKDDEPKIKQILFDGNGSYVVLYNCYFHSDPFESWLECISCK